MNSTGLESNEGVLIGKILDLSQDKHYLLREVKELKDIIKEQKEEIKRLTKLLNKKSTTK